jgi:hypothetical protein
MNLPDVRIRQVDIYVQKVNRKTPQADSPAALTFPAPMDTVLQSLSILTASSALTGSRLFCLNFPESWTGPIDDMNPEAMKASQHEVFGHKRKGHLQVQNVVLGQDCIEHVALEEFHARAQVQRDHHTGAEAPAARIAMELGRSLLQYRHLCPLLVSCAPDNRRSKVRIFYRGFTKDFGLKTSPPD